MEAPIRSLEGFADQLLRIDEEQDSDPHWSEKLDTDLH
jgi:hypothetical protein